MFIQKVSYQKTFPLAAYSNERVGVEIELGVSDSPAAALITAKNFVENFHKENNPPQEEYRGTSITEVVQVDKVEKLTVVESTIREMNNCTSLAVLKTFEKLASGNQDLNEAYFLKLKTFQ